MITPSVVSKNFIRTKFRFIFLIPVFFFSHAEGATSFVNISDIKSGGQPYLILGKNNLNNSNSSETITINGIFNGSFIIDGVNSYRVCITPQGITEERLKSNRTAIKKDVVDYAPPAENPVRVSIENLILVVNDEEECLPNEDDYNENGIVERSYSEGYSTVIFRHYHYDNKTEIEFVDERLSVRFNENDAVVRAGAEDDGEDDADDNPGIMAGYLDAIVMAPLIGIFNADDLVGNAAVGTAANAAAAGAAGEHPGEAAEGAEGMVGASSSVAANKFVSGLADDNVLNEDIRNIRSALLDLPNNNLLALALNLMLPVKFTDLDPIVLSNHSLLYSNICQHFNELCCCFGPENKLNIWGKAFGNFQNRKTDGFLTGYNSTTNGVFIGVDCCPVEALCSGGGFAFTYDDVKWKNDEADATNDTYYGFLYSSLHCRRCFLDAMVSLGYSSIDGNRYTRGAPVLERKARHSTHAWSYGGRLNAGLNFSLPGQIILQLYDALDLGNVDHKAFTEDGADALNLQVNRRSFFQLRNELGIQFSGTYFSPCKTCCWTPAIGVSWVYRNPLSNGGITARLQNQSLQYTVSARDEVTNQVSPEVSLTVRSIHGMYLSVYYDGEFGDNWNSNEVSMHVGKRF